MLIDAHVHLASNHLFNRLVWEGAGREKRVGWIRALLKEYKKQGIYVLRDGGDAIFASKLAREIAAEEGMIYRSPIFALYKKNRYGSFLGKPIRDLEDFKKEFKILLEHKPDHLKIILTGLVDFKQYGESGEVAFKGPELQYMVDAAKDRGLPVMVHANGREGVERAAAAGVHTIEHGYLISEAQVYRMAEKGIIWIPTLAPLGNILRTLDRKFGRKERAVISRVYTKQVENIRKAVEMGLKIALGSDAGAYAVVHGQGLFNELEHMQRIGLSRGELKKMCSENGSKALRLNGFTDRQEAP